MDPVSAIGVAAAIVQFVDLGTKIVKRLKDYSSAASEVPKSLQHISNQLPLLVNALDRLKTDVQVERFDFDTRCILKGVVAGCKQQVEKLDGIIDKLLNIPGEPWRVKVQKALASLRNDTKVLEIEKSLQTYIAVLTLHKIVEGTATSSLINEEDSYFEVHIRQATPFLQRVHWMQELETFLDPAATSQVLNPLVVYIAGQEAAGKTQLAVEYCHRARAIGHFPTIFWLNASTSQHLFRSLETISDIVRRSKEGLKDKHEKIEFVKSFLCNRWHPWLLVLDNYDPSQVKDPTDYLPSRSSGAILLITRHKSLLPASGNVISLPIYRDAEELTILRAELVDRTKNEDVEAVGRLLANGADPDSHGEKDWPCLHIASKRGFESIVELLLKGGSQPRTLPSWEHNIDGRGSALYVSASAGQTTVFKLLLDWEDAHGLSPQAPGNNAVLSVAAQNGHEEIVRRLVQHSSVHIDGRNKKNENALGLAAENGHANTVKLLSDHGANAEAESGGVLPIILALSRSHLHIVRILSANGKFDVNGVYRYRCLNRGSDTPLYHSSFCSWCYEDQENSIKVVKYLLDLGAKPNINGEKPYPLQAAVSSGNEQVVSLLLEHDADPNLSDKSSLPPLHQAALLRSINMVTVLLEHGVNPNSLGKITSRGPETFTHPLIEATKGGLESILSLLLERGADPNALGNHHSHYSYGETCPLIEATRGGFTNVVSVLLEHGADPYPVTQSTSPICKAAEYGHEAIVQLIIPAKARYLKIQRQQRQEALRTASAYGQTKVVSLLLEAGADIDAATEENKTPLRLAVEKGEISTARLLLKRGAREDIPDNSGTSPLFFATRRGLDLMVRAILLSTRKPDVQDSLGNTPLCLSAALGHEKMLELLLEMGADRNISNDLEETPLDLALAHGHRSIIKLLEQPVVER